MQTALDFVRFTKDGLNFELWLKFNSIQSLAILDETTKVVKIWQKLQMLSSNLFLEHFWIQFQEVKVKEEKKKKTG